MREAFLKLGTRSNLALLGLVTIVLSGAISIEAAIIDSGKKTSSVRDRSSRKILVHGHRGARAVLPENNLSALNYAIELGVDVLEFDLTMTKDKVLVLNHDRRLNAKYCLMPDALQHHLGTAIKEIYWSDLQHASCSQLPNPRFPKQKTVPGEKIIRFVDVLNWLNTSTSENAKKVLLNIETKLLEAKPEESADPIEFAAEVVRLIEKEGFVSRSIVQSFDFRTLRHVKKINPKIRTSALFKGPVKISRLPRGEARPEYVSPNYKFLDKAMTRRLQSLGFEVHPWTANSYHAWRKLRRMNVNGIITDDPKSLMDYLEKF